MEEGYSLERIIAEAGIHYPRSYDITYRIGYVLQSTGLLIFTALYIFRSPFSLVGLIIFESGIALSSIFLLVWKAAIKRFILWCTFFGIALQLISLLPLPIPFNAGVFIIGLALTLAGGAGLTGKEAYCFGFIEGWIILLMYPVIVFMIMLSSGHDINAVVFVILSLMHVSFLRKKLKQPLLKSCETNVCGLPEKKI